MGYGQSPVPGYYLGVSPAASPTGPPLIEKTAKAKKPRHTGMNKQKAGLLEEKDYQDVPQKT